MVRGTKIVVSFSVTKDESITYILTSGVGGVEVNDKRLLDS